MIDGFEVGPSYMQVAPPQCVLLQKTESAFALIAFLGLDFY
jgi:hypothetical protein